MQYNCGHLSHRPFTTLMDGVGWKLLEIVHLEGNKCERREVRNRFRDYN